MTKVLLLTDGKAGHENQSKAFARALEGECDIVKVEFRSKAAKMLSYLFDHLGIRTLRLFKPIDANGNYSAVIGTGSGTFYAVKAMAKKLGVKCGVVLYPRGYNIASFDCILAPSFDNPPKAANVVEIPVNLVSGDAAFYEAGVKAFRERYQSGNGKKAVAVIVGGPNKCSTMSAEWMCRQLETIFAQNPDAEKWVTTSRRTPSEVEAVIDAFPFDYRLLYSRDHFNPIPAFVSLAAKLYVTAESTGMLSEACTFGTAEVKVLDNLNPGNHKFRRFAKQCAAMGSRKADLSVAFSAARKLLQ